MPSTLQSIRIVIADDHPISRDGLRWLIQTEPGLLIVGETGANAQVASLVCEQQADILLIDFPVRGQAALEILREIAASGNGVRTIVLAENIESPDLSSALELGARAIVVKESAADVLFKCIRSVIEGKYWIDCDPISEPAATARALDLHRKRRKVFGLTPRELEIIRAVAAGHSNKDIAQTFSISENTVKSHLSHIFTKLGASNRVELVLFAAHHHLLGNI